MKNKITWIKEPSTQTGMQYRFSEDEHYAISGRYTYYWGHTPYYLPDGIHGEWIALDGMYKGKGSLEICRSICEEHAKKINSLQKGY